MYSGKLVDVLVVALSFSSLAQASFFNFNPLGQNSNVGQGLGDVLKVRRALHFLGREIREIVNRQTNKTTTSSSGPSTSTTTSSSSSSSSTTSTTTTSTSGSSSTSTTSTSTTSAPTLAPPTSPNPTSTPPTSATSTSSEPLQTTILTSFVTLTDSKGSPTATQKTEATAVVPASLANDGSNSSSGMSTQTRNTVIGVVVGIGGAIILIGLGLVAWRIWGRKRTPEETDGLMDSYHTPYRQAEKIDIGGTANSRTPFQSTLESYHAPANVNTASNF